MRSPGWHAPVFDILFRRLLWLFCHHGWDFSGCSRISGFRFLSNSNKNGLEIHFEFDFSPFRIQTVTLSHSCFMNMLECREITEQIDWRAKQAAKVACVLEDLKCWGAWDTICGFEAKDNIEPSVTWRTPTGVERGSAWWCSLSVTCVGTTTSAKMLQNGEASGVTVTVGRFLCHQCPAAFMDMLSNELWEDGRGSLVSLRPT